MSVPRFTIRWSETFNEYRIEGDVDLGLFVGAGLEVVPATDYDKIETRLNEWKENVV